MLAWVLVAAVTPRTGIGAQSVLRSVSGYYTDSDKNQHAIVATAQGALKEIYFSPTKGIATADLGCFGDVVAVAGFVTPDDGYQHVIVASRDGNIREVSFDPRRGISVSEPPLANFTGVVGVAAFQSPDDKYRIVIVATVDGALHEVYYHPSEGVRTTRPALAKFPGIVSMAAFGTSDDHNRVIVVGLRDGSIREVYYRPAIGVHVTSPPLATIPGLVSVAAFQAGDDNRRIVIAATQDGSIHEIFYHAASGVHVTTPALTVLPKTVSVSAYYTPNDRRRHVIVAADDGAVHEIFYGGGSGVGVLPLHQFGPVAVTRVEVTQGLQDLDNSVPLFKGKRTLLRAYLNGGSCSPATELRDAAITVTVLPQGNATTPTFGPVTVGPVTLPASASRDFLSNSVNLELPPDGAFFAPWATDKDYVLRVTPRVAAGVGEPLETRLRFYESVPFHLRVFYDTATGRRVSRTTVDQAVNRLRALYPVRDVIVHDMNNAADGISWGMLGTWRALAQMGDQAAIAQGLAPPNCSSCFFMTIPWVSAGSVPFGLANPWPNHDSQVAMDGTDINWSTGTFAQELAHNLGRLHASSAHNEQAPSDPSFPNAHGEISDSTTITIGNLTTRGKYYGADPGTNPARPGGQWWIIPAYDASDGSHHHDFMSYGAWVDIWTSAYTYYALCGANRVGRFDSWYIRASDLGAASLPPAPPCAELSADPTWGVQRNGRQPGPASEELLVRGKITEKGAVELEPMYRLTLPADASDESDKSHRHADHRGEVRVVLLAADGTTLVDRGVLPPSHGKAYPIFARLPWSERVRSVVLRRDGVDIARVARSAKPPVPRFGLLPHGRIAKSAQVTWTVGETTETSTSGAILLFSPDSGRAWVPVAVDARGGKWNLDPAALPGTRHGKLRLIVSDGLNAATIDGPADIVVDPKPPLVNITAPSTGSSVAAGGRLILHGTATSPQSGELPSERLTWYAGGVLLGRGQSIEAKGLPAGTTEIRLEVTDRNGMRGSSRIRVSLDPSSVAVRSDRAGTVLPSIGAK